MTTNPNPTNETTAIRVCGICQQPIADNADPTIDPRDLVCPSCQAKIDDYKARVAARHARLQAAAERAQKESDALLGQARKMASVIPFGQPILVGHYSEGRDRRYRDRIDKKYRKGFALMDEAKRLADRAEDSINSRTISPDDPQAIIKYKAKLADLEKFQTYMKAVNVKVRALLKSTLSPEDQAKALVALASEHEQTLSIERAADMLKGDLLKRKGFPSYALTNNNAMINDVKERIKRIETRAVEIATNPEPVTREERQGVTIERDLAENRLRLIFPSKPSPKIIAALKYNGFRWSPYNKAWQRFLNGYAAEYHAKEIVKLVEDENQ